MSGDPRVILGSTLQIDKISNGVDGGYRVDEARHEFSKHGYFIDFKCTRISKKPASSAAAQKGAQQQQQQAKQAEQEKEKADADKAKQNPAKPDPVAQAQAKALKDAADRGVPFCEKCEEAKKKAAQEHPQ